MRKVVFKEDYDVTEFPQHGGHLVQGRKGKSETVSTQLADLLINDLGKAEPYKEAAVKQESEDEDEDEDGEGEGEDNNDKNEGPSFLRNTPWSRDKERAEN